MTKIIFTVAATFIMIINARGQEYFYTLNQYTPVIYHPSFPANDNAASISFLNRRTQITSGISYQNNIFNGEYPIIDRNSGRRFGGIGLYMIQKDAGNSDLIETYNIGLSLAYNLPIRKDQFVSFGIQSGYNNKKTSLESITTGSQWLAAEFRFDPEADVGESIIQNRINYFNFNAGLNWYLQNHDDGSVKASVGVTAFNLNKPADSFIDGESRVPVAFMVNTGASIYHTRRIILSPELIYLRENNNSAFNILVSNKIFFSNENPYDIIRSGNVELLGKYDLQKDLSFGIVLNQPGISLGFSYNFLLGNESANQYFHSGTEFGLKLSKTIWQRKPAKVVIKNSPVGNKRSFDFTDRQKNVATERVSDAEIIQEKIEDLSKVSAVRFELDKDFKFGFGKVDLSPEAKLYLDDFYKVLQDNPEYKLDVIGHTDNVGKHLVNYRLSLARAQAVAKYLEYLGLSEDRVRFLGRGDTEPIAANDTEENRSKNRRVQFIIYINR